MVILWTSQQAPEYAAKTVYIEFLSRNTIAGLQINI
jgi:hypothetical protein